MNKSMNITANSLFDRFLNLNNHLMNLWFHIAAIMGLRYSVWKYEKNKQKEQSSIVDTVTKQNLIFQLPCEISQLIEIVQNLSKVDGDIAEVGVYKGATAKLIAQIKGSKALHLFDTFEGFPDISSHDPEFLRKGQLNSNHCLKDLKNHFSSYADISINVGIFPKETGHYIEDKRFSFVHLDVDLYESTLESLRFFYPRLNKGGIILSHDYRSLEGVKLAFNDFFKELPEYVIPAMGTTCLVVKT